ncbi:MAG TPA: DUF1326 domain-containing protein [Acidobacteriota bacterium]|nr:DUF1326 domain-containing protein [Acidobacteriota bacterium]
MKKLGLFLGVFAAFLCLSVLAEEMKKEAAATPDWHMNATAIEACSCPMFCQCYFNTAPAAHHSHEGAAEHYCRANLAYKINKGNHGSVNLDGAKFWVVSDLGADFSKGQMDWAVVYFDKTLSKEQKDGIAAIVGHLFPVKWNSLTTAEADIDTWEYTNDSAHATMDGGKTAEVKLKRMQGMTNEPVVIRNLVYWGAPRNDGFVLMPNEVEAYRVGPKAFEYKGTNGFMITVDLDSKDLAKKSAGSH